MIRINDDYVVAVDEYNYTLQKDLHSDATDKNGVTRHKYKTIGYYSSLYKAILGYKEVVGRECMSRDDMALGEACTRLERINEEFKKILEEHSITDAV